MSTPYGGTKEPDGNAVAHGMMPVMQLWRRTAPATPRLLAAAACAVVLGAVAALPVAADHGGTHITLEPDTNGCNGVLPSTSGNTDMTLVGGSLQPGGTAIFQITYPVNAASVGKEFTILDCAFINGVAALRYTVEFVPSNQSFVLSLTLAIPTNAPVGGQYCNYIKTTGAPTAAQGSQRKAGPACFTILPPTTAAAPPAAPVAPAGPPAPGATPAPAGPLAPRLPDTSTMGGDLDPRSVGFAALLAATVMLMPRARLALSRVRSR